MVYWLYNLIIDSACVLGARRWALTADLGKNSRPMKVRLLLIYRPANWKAALATALFYLNLVDILVWTIFIGLSVGDIILVIRFSFVPYILLYQYARSYDTRKAIDSPAEVYVRSAALTG
jgi:hypothetical protein